MFKRWCRQQGFCKSGSNLSHVLMDGGVLSVPFDRLNDFYIKYIDAVKSGEKVYVVEQKTERFHFFVDLDYKCADQVSFDEMQEFCDIICQRVSNFTKKKALVSVAEPKQCDNLIKYGVHINWHGFVVDQGSAKALHSHIVHALNLDFPETNWNSVVDTSVYGGGKNNAKGSGFRMPWSHKKSKHGACNGVGCDGCDKGKVTQGWYIPILIYDGKFQRVHKCEPSVDILHLATLRTESTDYAVIEGSVRVEGSFTTQETKNIFNDTGVLLSLQNFIRKHVEGQTNADVTNVYIQGDIYLVSTNSRYCENIRRKHASNHVWFMVEGDTVIQKCFCRCDTTVGRLNGYCKDFSGRAIRLPDNIYKALYPKGGFRKPVFKLPTKCITPAVESPTDVIDTYINKHITNCKVKSITKFPKEWKVITNLVCNGCNKSDIQFVIKKKTESIQQACSCNNRMYKLTDKIIDML